MRLEQLEYVAAVTQHGSLRRASEHLHVSQPALGEAITKLERELGVTLVERHRSGARMSAAGQELLLNISQILEAVENLKVAAGLLRTSARVARIGTVNAGTASLVLPAIRGFQEQFPGSTVEIRNLQQSDIQAGLDDGTLDLGLVNLLDGDDLPPTLKGTALLAGQPVAVLPASHPLAVAAEVDVEDLRNEPFVGMRSGYLMHRFAHRLFGAAAPAEWHVTDGADMGKMMVADGMGVAILPDYSVYGDPMERAGVIVGRPIARNTTTVTMVAVHRRRQRPPAIVRDLLRHLVSSARSAQRSGSRPRPETPVEPSEPKR